MAQEITIMIADDHPVFRRGLRQILESQHGFQIIGEASDGEMAYELIKTRKPGVAILDIEMPKMTGLEVAAAVQRNDLQTALLVLTMYEESSIFDRAMDLGVTGYLVKDTADDDIVLAVKEVALDRYFISPRLVSNAIKKRRNVTASDVALNLGQLTITERFVLRLIALSKSTREIGLDLSISPRTVERHRYKICQKLHLSGSYSLLRYALENRNLLEDNR